MKIKIPNSAATKQKVEAHLATLKRAVSKFTQAGHIAAELAERHSDLTERIAKLEVSASPDDEAAMQDLSKAREALRLTESRLEARRTVSAAASPEGVALADLLATFRDTVVYPALSPAHEVLIADLAEKLRPYTRKGGWARDFAARSDLASAFAGHIGRDFGREPSIIEARRAIALCEAIIAGELDFPFETD